VVSLRGNRVRPPRVEVVGSALGLGLALCAAALLATAFGIGRTGAGFVGRYFALAAMSWCVVLLIGSAWHHVRLARLGQAALVVVIVLLMPLNVHAGLRYGREYHGRMARFQKDLRSGQPAAQLVANHAA